MAPAKQQKISRFQAAAPLRSAYNPTSPSPITTPERHGIAASIHAAITQAQKQALIDNLQLEIAERARKLRATYSLQTQNLRSRLEMRVNRIPTAYRAMKIGDLLEKERAVEVAKAEAPKPATAKQTQAKKQAAPTRGTKRSSSQMASDKENIGELVVPKKRTKIDTAAAPQPTATRPVRATSTKRTVPASQILSPKENNAQASRRGLVKSSVSSSQPKRAIRSKATSQEKAKTTSVGSGAGRVLRSRK